MSVLRTRRSLTEIQWDHARDKPKQLDDLMRAWKTIKDLPPDDPRSFFVLGGFHGEPFRGAGWANAQYWGGYCNHGNVLFPTWHRAYLVKIEEALQSVPGCADVMLPYWNETGADSRQNGIPWALTDEHYTFADGEKVDNPLRSFVFTKNIKDHINNDSPDYSKPAGYETKRYPLSGLVGTADDRAASEAHNAQYPHHDTNVGLLNDNIVNWLNATVVVDGKPITAGQVAQKYTRCLDAPNYTVFSNTTSAAQWNDEHVGGDSAVVVPLESPHNSIHLAVGGFDVPNLGDFSPISGANGDMGENDTAGLDPIFFFHHCFVDRMFWQWQQRHEHDLDATNALEILAEYPGTNSVDSQGPTPGVVPNSWLTLDSPLDPFTLVDDAGNERAYTSRDCINIEEQMHYTYEPDQDDGEPFVASAAADAPVRSTAGHARRTAVVSGVNRAPVRGSFLVSVFGTVDGERVHLGTEAVLSRWSVKYCANCQTHLEVRSFHELDQPAGERLDDDTIEVEIHTRDGVYQQLAATQSGDAAHGAPVMQALRLEVR